MGLTLVVESVFRSASVDGGRGKKQARSLYRLSEERGRIVGKP